MQHILEASSPAEARQDRRRLRNVACRLGCPAKCAGRHTGEDVQELIRQHLAPLVSCGRVAALHLQCGTQCTSAGQQFCCRRLQLRALPTCVHQIGRLRRHERGVLREHHLYRYNTG